LGENKKGQKRGSNLLPFSVLLPESLTSSYEAYPFGGVLPTRSPEMRPVIVPLPERLVPRAFLELAPSVVKYNYTLLQQSSATYSFPIFRLLAILPFVNFLFINA
jgi:hypothetical protein